MPISKFIAHTQRRIDVGGIEAVTIRDTVVDGAVHGAGIGVEVFVEEVVGVD
jgi:hypothetical protein